jgi:hypothetical protein
LTSAGFAAAAAVVEAQEFWQVMPVPKSKKSFKLDRPIVPECPLHTRADSPADARLGGGEAKWRDDRRIRKNTLRGQWNELHQTASGGRDLAVELSRSFC